MIEAAPAGPELHHPPTANKPPSPSRLGIVFEKFCHIFFAYYCRLETHGPRPPADTRFLICSNHRSHLDSLAIMTAVRLPFASCGLLAAQDYFFRSPMLLRLLNASLRLIPVSRRPHAHEFNGTIEACIAFLRDGGNAIIVYPEGTRSYAATVSPFKRGAAILAMRLGIPILPVFVSGTDRIMPKNRFFPRLGPIEVRFGPLMHIDASLRNPHDKEASSQLAKEIESQVVALSRQSTQ